MMSRLCLLVTLLCVLWHASLVLAADNELTTAERETGWRLLFDGKTTQGWLTSDRKPGRTHVEQNALNPHQSGHYMLIYDEPFENFILSLDFKISPKCNSGVFVRTWPLEPRPGKDVGFNGIEIAIDDTSTAGLHDTGAIYDLVAPRRNTMHPAGEWNHLVITCDRNQMDVQVNGTAVTHLNLEDWNTPNHRPDGSEHKFDIAFKDHPRRGYLGLQDHGSPCWYKNIKLKPLP